MLAILFSIFDYYAAIADVYIDYFLRFLSAFSFLFLPLFFLLLLIFIFFHADAAFIYCRFSLIFRHYFDI